MKLSDLKIGMIIELREPETNEIFKLKLLNNTAHPFYKCYEHLNHDKSKHRWDRIGNWHFDEFAFSMWNPKLVSKITLKDMLEGM